MTAAALEARRFLRRCDSGALSTVSLRHPGYPFGSVVSFVPDQHACPVILVSRLAEHTRNLAADPRCSLLVRDTAADVQAGARVTVIARAESLIESETIDRFVRYTPGAQRLVDLGDFSFVRLQPLAVRYIGGFGSIHWVTAESFVPREALDERRTRELISASRLENVELVGVDCDGADVTTGGQRRRLDFDSPAFSPEAASSAYFQRLARPS
jgi:hypothetical protein